MNTPKAPPRVIPYDEYLNDKLKDHDFAIAYVKAMREEHQQLIAEERAKARAEAFEEAARQADIVKCMANGNIILVERLRLFAKAARSPEGG